MAVIGIDFGATCCAAGACVDGRLQSINLEGETTMPSVVSLQKNGKLAVGKTAKRNRTKALRDTVVEVKRRLGEDVAMQLGKHHLMPQDVTALILRKIKQMAEADLGEEVTGAVISCPAYFERHQREAVHEAGRIAGINVLKIVDEPVAAAHAYGIARLVSKEKRLYLVFDMGGCTLDVTLLLSGAGVLERLGSGANLHLGGNDFDERIVDWACEHLQKLYPRYFAALSKSRHTALRLRLKQQAEEVKIRLCESQDKSPTYVFEVREADHFEGEAISLRKTLSLEDFETFIGSLVKRALDGIDDALEAARSGLLTDKQIEAVMLVGGSTRVPLVRRLLEKRFGKRRILQLDGGMHPDEIVALGSALLAEAEEAARADVLDPWKSRDSVFAARMDYTYLQQSIFDARDAEERWRDRLEETAPFDLRDEIAAFIAAKQKAYREAANRPRNDYDVGEAERTALDRSLNSGLSLPAAKLPEHVSMLDAPREIRLGESVKPAADAPLVFISANRKDYAHAGKVYQFLALQGLRVFFSPESLFDGESTDFRAQIDRALNDSDHMVVVTSSSENVGSKWVEAEWGGFINELRSGRKSGNILTLLVGTIALEDLPLALRQFEARALNDESLGKILHFLGRTKKQ